jgi:hypothetical protein
MYLLVALALAATGSGVGQVWALTHDTGLAVAAEGCLLGQGFSPSEVMREPGSADARSGLAEAGNRCAAGLDRDQGIGMAVGAVLVPAAAWLLMLGGGLGLRWRLRRRRSGLADAPAGQAAAKRFGAWCDACDLKGRRRPRLLLAAPGRGTAAAFTTGLPAGRPLVLVPVNLACADQATLDFVILHELAHVRSRDLTWASAVWWAGWLSVPAVLLAASPVVSLPSTLLGDFGRALETAAVLSAALLALRASLLRRREHAADQHAAALGGTAPLARALRHQPAARTGGGRGRLRAAASAARSAMAAHPAPAARARAVTAVLDRAEGGFAVTAAAGMLAMFAYQALLAAVTFLRDGAPPTGLPARLLLAVPCLLWAWVVVPAWGRRAAAAARAGCPAAWAGPLSGAVAGLVAGYCTTVPGAVFDAGLITFSGDLPLVVAVLIIVTAGVGVLAAGAAAAASACPARRALALAGAVAAAGTALSVTLGSVPGVLNAHLIPHSSAVVRQVLLGDGNTWLWGASFLIMAAGLAAASPVIAAGRRAPRPARRGPRPVAAVWLVTGAATVIGGAAAGLSWQLRIQPGPPADLISFLDGQRSWICALAGWAASAVALLTGRGGSRPAGAPAGIPATLAAGFLATILAEAATAWGTGDQHDLGAFASAILVSTWLLFVTVIITLPLLAGTAVVMARARRRQLRRPRPMLAALAAGAATGALSLALLAGILAPVTTAPHDERQASLALRSAEAAWLAGDRPPRVPVAPPAAGRHDPGRRVSPPAGRAALASVRRLLPPGWKQTANGKPLAGVRPAPCQHQLTLDARPSSPHTADITDTYTFPVQRVWEGQMTLAVSLTSYGRAAPGFSADRKEAAVCAHFTLLVQKAVGGVARYSVSGGAYSQLRYPAYRTNVFGYATFPTLGKETTLRLTGFSDTVGVGHNQATAAVSYKYAGALPPTAIPGYAEHLARNVLLAVIAGLTA